MSINSRLGTLEKSLKGRELALLWLKTSQARGGFLEYWKNGEFQPWVSGSEEGALLYYLAFHINGAVVTTAQKWREMAGYASPLALLMIFRSSDLEQVEMATDGTFVELLRARLFKLLCEVVAMERAVNLISEGYFDGHDVLFVDVRESLTSSWGNTKLLVAGYNFFATENGKASIDIEELERRPVQGVEELLNEWVMLSRSSALVAGGKIFEARDEVLRFLNTTNPSPFN